MNNSLVGADTETVRARRPSSPGEPATLTILDTSQHNNSVVQCRATISNGFDTVRPEVSITETLTVRETVFTYLIVAPNTITVMWNAQPLTEYCVDINTGVGTVVVILRKQRQNGGIEQPNEAYAPVLKLKKNIAYEQTKKPRGQRIDGSQVPVTMEGEYAIIEPVHVYEDVLPEGKASRANYVNIN